MKLVVSDTKSGRTVQIDVPEEKRALITGKQIGNEIQGDDFGLPGYTLKLTGGSDTSGFPMRSSVSGSRKVKSLVSGGPGFKPERKGQRKKKVFRGDTYSPEITQVNSMVSKPGANSFDELFPKEEKAEKEEGK